MLNSIREKRLLRDGVYELTLQIPEDEYFDIYDSIKSETGEEILNNYFIYKQDDGRFEDVSIKHNKNGHIVDITAKVHYTGNDHTEATYTPDYLNINRNTEE